MTLYIHFKSKETFASGVQPIELFGTGSNNERYESIAFNVFELIKS